MTLQSLNMLAQSANDSFRTIEYDLPQSSLAILVLLAGLVLLFGLTFVTSFKDSRFLKMPWRILLLTLRVTVLALLLLVLLNPRERSQTSQIQKSRVGILVDTSLSMAYPATAVEDSDAEESAAGAGVDPKTTRAEEIQKVLINGGLLDKLSQTHAVSVYTFDSSLKGPQAVVADGSTSFVSGLAANDEEQTGGTNDTDGAARLDLSADGAATVDPDSAWQQILQPAGSETRLGEALHQLIGDLSGRTLSGIVVLTDGRTNAGLDTEVARERAARSETKLLTIGVGSEKPQVNLWMAGMQSPSDVHRGDPFDVAVILQGSGLIEQSGKVALYQQSAGSDGKDRQKVDEQPFQLGDNGIPLEIRFQQQLNVPGKYEYVAIAELSDNSLRELTMEDNQRRRELEVSDRKQKVLIISSGPMREYQFVRNTLFRHSGIDSDVWLQTIKDENRGMVSQESTRLLTQFPTSEAQLFEYDVIVAFDANWNLLSAKQRGFLNNWVDEHSGGIIFVAGEIFTPEIARNPDKIRDITVLYPVVLNRMLAELRVSQRADKPWPVLLSDEGKASEFLKISDATGKTDVELWKTFKGIFRSYPVKSVRDGAVVLARYGNPRASTQDGLPPFLASQFYGKGRTMFVGSAETWRLRAISAEGHQRFWTSMIREVGQGRRRRGPVARPVASGSDRSVSRTNRHHPLAAV